MSPRFVILALALVGAAAGCVGSPEGASVETASAQDGEILVLAPSTEEIAGDILLSIATPARTLNNGGAFLTTMELTANMTGVVIEITWDAASPASEQLSLWIRPAGSGAVDPTDPAGTATSNGEPFGKADGASPLRLALPADAFPGPGEHDIVVRASAQPVGAAAQQPFTIHLTTFEDIAYDESFSALGEAHSH